jgi:hypothetical protein
MPAPSRVLPRTSASSHPRPHAWRERLYALRRSRDRPAELELTLTTDAQTGTRRSAAAAVFVAPRRV